jgi:hypothetical protein
MTWETLLGITSVMAPWRWRGGLHDLDEQVNAEGWPLS